MLSKGISLTSQLTFLSAESYLPSCYRSCYGRDLPQSPSRSCKMKMKRKSYFEKNCQSPSFHNSVKDGAGKHLNQVPEHHHSCVPTNHFLVISLRLVVSTMFICRNLFFGNLFASKRTRNPYSMLHTNSTFCSNAATTIQS